MTILEPRRDIERESLIRMSPVELRSEGDSQTLVGYAAVFNEDTVIDSWEGHFVERIAPGAFRKTLRERGNQVKVLFNHGMDPQIGDKPLGKPRTMKEDEKGLYVEVPLDDTSYNRDILASLRSGALDGMSFRMTVVAEKWDDPDESQKLPVRTIREIKLYEFGPVTFPAYAATVAGVRAHAPAAFQAWRTATEPPIITASGTANGTLTSTDLGQQVIAAASAEALRTAVDPSVDPNEIETPETPKPLEVPEPEPVTPDPEPEPAAATRDDEAATTGTPSPYQPAQPPALTPERRETQMGLVRAMYAQHENRNPRSG
jgi:HK97 family phage prohead protease